MWNLTSNHGALRTVRPAAALALFGLALGLAGCGAIRPAPSAEQDLSVVSAPTGAVTLASPHQRRFDAAVALMRNHDWNAARALWRDLVDDAPDLQSARTNLGIALMRQGEDNAARRALTGALELGPDCAAWTWLGVIERRAGNLEASEGAYRACIDHDANYAPAHRNLGVLQEIYLGRLAEARASYATYQELRAADDPTVALWLSDLERRLDPATQFAVTE